MFSDLSNFLGLLIAALAIAAAGGAGWQRGKIGKLRTELEDADKRADRLAARLDEAEAALSKRDEEVKTLRHDLDAIVREVRGDAHWLAVTAQLSEHDKAAREHWTAQLTLLQIIADQGKART